MVDTNKFWKKVHCRICQNKTNHGIIFKHTISEEFDEVGFWWSEDYIIGQCLGCDTLCFIKQYDDTSMHFSTWNEDSNSYEHIDADDIKVFPSEPINKTKEHQYSIVEFQHLPELLNELYKQVVANYVQKHFLLAAAGLRMIIEGICNDLSIESGYLTDDETGEFKVNNNGDKISSSNLNGKINGLVERGILTTGQTAILHIIRKLGNQTVHKLNNPKPKILLQSLEIIEQTFKNIYEIKKYEKMRKQINM